MLQEQRKRKRYREAMIEECQDKLKAGRTGTGLCTLPSKKVEIPVEKPVLYQKKYGTVTRQLI